MAVLQSSLSIGELIGREVPNLTRAFARAASSTTTSDFKKQKPLSRIRLSEEALGTVTETLEQLGLEIEEAEAKVPERPRKLFFHRSGTNAFVEIPEGFLDNDEEWNFWQVKQLELALKGEVSRLFILSRSAIHPSYTKEVFQRWERQVFDVVESYSPQEWEFFRQKPLEERVEHLRQKVDGGAVEDPREPSARVSAEAPVKPPLEVQEPGKIDGVRRGQLSEIIRSTFTVQRFKQFLDYRLNKSLEEYTSPSADYSEARYDLIKAANNEGWISELVLKLRYARPHSVDLIEFAESLQLVFWKKDETRSGLEAKLKGTSGFRGWAAFAKAGGQVERQICSVRIGGKHKGTGFLLGPGVVMTNYHVLESVIEDPDPAAARKVRCVFDYSQLPDGSEEPGTQVKLAPGNKREDWLIDFSPMHPDEKKALRIPKNVERPSDMLDYALVKLAEAVGDAAVGGGDALSKVVKKRGFIKVWDAGYDFPDDDPVLIMQHPRGLPVQFAIETKAILDANQTRVRYRIDTEPGSSGSPCFTFGWELIALHHYGDPDTPFTDPDFNQGIPFDAILGLLEKRKKRDQLGS